MVIISKKSKKDFTSIGNIKSIKTIPRGISFEFTNGKGKILIYSSNLIRFVITPHTEFNIDYSYAVIKYLENWLEMSYDINEQSEKVLISTDDLIIEVIKAPYEVLIKENRENEPLLCSDDEGGKGVCYENKGSGIRSYKKIRPNDHFFGFGEKTGPLDKKGQYMEMHGREMPYKGNIDPMYQNHPYFISVANGVAYGIFLDNISKTNFDMGKKNPNEYYFGTNSGELNYYFIYGPSIQQILETYTELTGRIEMPPKWAIGNQQCRYSYKNEKEIRGITSKFRANKIPCDVIWFDIHYMDGYRCFTFNKKRFPNPKDLMEDLKSEGFQPVVIVDPGIKIDDSYPISQEMIEKKYYVSRRSGEPTVGLVWPGYVLFPDFTREEVREWWAEKHKYYFELGIEGIWNDMNEPALSVNPVKSILKRLNSKDMYFDDQGRNTHYNEGKNIYALCENWATWLGFKKYLPNKRPFILTRSGYSGIQRYAAIWTGDNWTNWKQ